MARQGGSGPVRALVFMAIAVVLGSTSLVFLYGLITMYQAQIDEARRPEDTTMVIVAARDLYQGVTITEEDVYMLEIPPRLIPEGVFLSPEHVVGRTPRERILANEFIRSDRLSDPESGIGLNAIIPRGMRAISVDISDGRALSGFLNPGDYVDIMVTMPDEKRPDVTETRTLLQAVFVLGVNSRMGNETREEAAEKRRRTRPSVTLLVNTEQAEILAHHERMGRLQLSLRNAQDVAHAETGGVSLDQLRSKLELPRVIRRRAPPPPQEEIQELKIIRGTKVQTERVGEDGQIKR